MTWIKCSDKLPEVGMLIIFRTPWRGEYDYQASLVKSDNHGMWIAQDDNKLYLFKEIVDDWEIDLEWKEVEKD